MTIKKIKKQKFILWFSAWIEINSFQDIKKNMKNVNYHVWQNQIFFIYFLNWNLPAGLLGKSFCLLNMLTIDEFVESRNNVKRNYSKKDGKYIRPIFIF